LIALVFDFVNSVYFYSETIIPC